MVHLMRAHMSRAGLCTRALWQHHALDSIQYILSTTGLGAMTETDNERASLFRSSAPLRTLQIFVAKYRSADLAERRSRPAEDWPMLLLANDYELHGVQFGRVAFLAGVCVLLLILLYTDWLYAQWS